MLRHYNYLNVYSRWTKCFRRESSCRDESFFREERLCRWQSSCKWQSFCRENSSSSGESSSRGESWCRGDSYRREESFRSDGSSSRRQGSFRAEKFFRGDISCRAVPLAIWGNEYGGTNVLHWMDSFPCFVVWLPFCAWWFVGVCPWLHHAALRYTPLGRICTKEPWHRGSLHDCSFVLFTPLATITILFICIIMWIYLICWCIIVMELSL